MKLELFSSKRGNDSPNLVGIQAADLDMLPTVLVCPLLVGGEVSDLRAVVVIRGLPCVAYCDLARPINRRILVKVGELSESDSRLVMAAFRRLLAD